MGVAVAAWISAMMISDQSPAAGLDVGDLAYSLYA
jgi:hypothetical protein